MITILQKNSQLLNEPRKKSGKYLPKNGKRMKASNKNMTARNSYINKRKNRYDRIEKQ